MRGNSDSDGETNIELKGKPKGKRFTTRGPRVSFPDVAIVVLLKVACKRTSWWTCGTESDNVRVIHCIFSALFPSHLPVISISGGFLSSLPSAMFQRLKKLTDDTKQSIVRILVNEGHSTPTWTRRYILATRRTDQNDICRGRICNAPLNLHDETLQISDLRARPLKRSRQSQSQSQRPPNMVDVMTRNYMRTGYRQLHVITISHNRPDMPQHPLRLIHRALDTPWHQDRK